VGPDGHRVASGTLTVGEALRWATRLLASSGLESPRFEAELLLTHVLGADRAGLQIGRDEPLPPVTLARVTDLVRRRAAHEPAAYLLGRRAFYDLDLYVAPGVLIPRPESEQLVEVALSWCRSHPDVCRRLVDVGTGSGALAIALARHVPEAHVIAIDDSAKALSVARRNVARYGLEERVTLVRGDLLNPLSGPFDVIVANLPYVPSARLETLAPEVREHEPLRALDGGPDGLDVLRTFVPQVPARLASPGLLLLEIDEGQGGAVAALVHQHLPEASVTVLHDLAGLERVVRASVGDETA